jgi:glycosyltransferase involved in cell wall biosynthesis
MVIQRFRPDFGGQGIQAEQLCQSLARRDIASVIFCATRGRPSEWESHPGYRVRRLRADLLPGSAQHNGLWMPTFAARVFAGLMRLTRVDVVHVHGVHDGFYGAFAYCRLRRVPIVLELTLMGADDPASVLSATPAFSRARHYAYRHCDAYVAMSRAFLPSYEAAGMPQDRLRVIPQGVNSTRFRPAGSDIRIAVHRELGCPAESPLVTFVGSLIERKGIDVLIAAWARVHESVPDAHLVLVGRDDFPHGSQEALFLTTHLTALPERARRTIHRLGLRNDPERFLGAADVFAFPSRREGFGTVIVEAMACGVPAVVARLDGITDFVFSAPASVSSSSLADGIVVSQNDPKTLATALIELLRNPDRARSIGNAGRQRVVDQFDFDTAVAPAYERVYESLERRTRA